MVQYLCDWCKAVKQPGETWLLGFAAEAVAPTAARREISLVSTWDAARSVDLLAVHFCSMEHYDAYARALFRGPVESETVVETEVEAPALVRRKVVRTVGKRKPAKGRAGAKRGRKSA